MINTSKPLTTRRVSHIKLKGFFKNPELCPPTGVAQPMFDALCNFKSGTRLQASGPVCCVAVLQMWDGGRRSGDIGDLAVYHTSPYQLCEKYFLNAHK